MFHSDGIASSYISYTYIHKESCRGRERGRRKSAPVTPTTTTVMQGTSSWRCYDSNGRAEQNTRQTHFFLHECFPFLSFCLGDFAERIYEIWQPFLINIIFFFALSTDTLRTIRSIIPRAGKRECRISAPNRTLGTGGGFSFTLPYHLFVPSRRPLSFSLVSPYMERRRTVPVECVAEKWNTHFLAKLRNSTLCCTQIIQAIVNLWNETLAFGPCPSARHPQSTHK